MVAPVDQALRVVALNDEAARRNLRLGMALADARAMYPDLPVAEADPAADRNALDAIANWADRYTPLIGLDPPDGLLLDVTGCAHLFHGEAALGRDLVHRLAAQGFSARAAVAGTVGCAWGLARYGDAVVVPPAGERAALAALPLAALRLPPDIVEALSQVGLRLVVDVLGKPRAPLAARFGAAFVRRLDQALGHEAESIVPRRPVPEAIAERRFPEPIVYEDDVLGTVEHLAGDLARVLERRGEGARLLELALFRADGAVHRLEVGTAAPLRDPRRIRRLFTDRLAALGDACDPGFGYDTVRLSARIAARSDPFQAGFVSDEDDAELAHLIDRLGARFGLRRVTRLVLQDTHIPERAAAALPVHGSQALAPQLAPPLVPAVAQDSLSPPRPIRLLAPPEPIEVLAEVPEGPPLRFRWRRVLYDVAVAEGPERIAPEWWRKDRDGPALTRDYFRVESRQGARLWLYRDGIYGREAGAPRWYLHGLFA